MSLREWRQINPYLVFNDFIEGIKQGKTQNKE